MNFEKLEVWKRACELSVAIYRELKYLTDRGFKDQITRSSLSVPSNIAEGMVRPTSRDKVRFLHIANGSCAEIRTQVYVGIQISYITEEIGNIWIQETKEISSMLSSLIAKIEL